MADVESFQLDHTKVLAPYVRLIGAETGPKGDVITNFDVRLVQPNEQEIPTAGLHRFHTSLPSRSQASGEKDSLNWTVRPDRFPYLWSSLPTERITWLCITPTETAR